MGSGGGIPLSMYIDNLITLNVVVDKLLLSLTFQGQRIRALLNTFRKGTFALIVALLYFPENRMFFVDELIYRIQLNTGRFVSVRIDFASLDQDSVPRIMFRNHVRIELENSRPRDCLI